MYGATTALRGYIIDPGQTCSSFLTYSIPSEWEHRQPIAPPLDRTHFSRYSHCCSILRSTSKNSRYFPSWWHRPLGIVHCRVDRRVSHMKYWSRPCTFFNDPKRALDALQLRLKRLRQNASICVQNETFAAAKCRPESQSNAFLRRIRMRFV